MARDNTSFRFDFSCRIQRSQVDRSWPGGLVLEVQETERILAEKDDICKELEIFVVVYAAF